jgi:1,4-dihydroxy-2-naphthoate octaprenyltransferase
LLDRWLRAIRLKFLLASLIASAIGISFALMRYSSFDLNSALLTLTGVFSLHASIDLFNDYWDYKRGIDKAKASRRAITGPRKITKYAPIAIPIIKKRIAAL